MIKYIYIFAITFYYTLNHKNIYYLKLLTVLFSCDRSMLLNKTITNFFDHMKYYEPHVKYNLYFVDSGTLDRLKYIQHFRIRNIFFLNPTDPEYTYNMFWSYLHDEYVLFLEDDRPFIKGIERNVIYTNFIEESILILKTKKHVKGITFKKDVSISSTILNVKTYLGNHILCVIKVPIYNFYYYSNGPAVYGVKYLLKTGNFISENHMAKVFKEFKWYIGYTYKGIICKSHHNISAECQGISNHLGGRISTKHKNSICKKFMY